MSDDHPQDGDPRRAQQAEDEARRLQVLTGMSVDAARAWLAFCGGRAARQ
jgi:hypothetical protein